MQIFFMKNAFFLLEMIVFLTIANQLVMRTIEQPLTAEVFNLGNAHPTNALHLFLLKTQLLHPNIATQQVQKSKLILVSPNFHEFKIGFLHNQANLLLHLAQHGLGKIGLAALHMARRRSVVVTLRRRHFLDQVLPLVVIDQHGDNGNHVTERHMLSPFDNLARAFQAFVI